MRGDIALSKITGISDKYIQEVANDLSPSGVIINIRHDNPWIARFLNSGWGVALICGVVAFATLFGIVMAGRNAPSLPPIAGTSAESDISHQDIITQEETENITTSSTETESEPPTEEETIPPVVYNTEFQYVSGSGYAEICAYEGKAPIVYTTPIADFGYEQLPINRISNHAFYENAYVKEVYFTEGITEIGNEVFVKCKKLQKVVIPEGVTEIGCRMFVDCSALDEVVFPQTLMHIGYDCFEGSRILKDKTKWQDGYRYLGDVLVKASNDTAKGDLTIQVPTRLIAGSAFDGCRGLTSVILPTGLQGVGQYAFKDCGNLQTVTLPDGVLHLDYGAFLDCTNLQSINLPQSLLTMGDSVLSGCQKLTSIQIPSGVTRLERHALYGCTSLTSITLHDGITYIGDAAFGGTDISSITLPKSLEYLGCRAFGGCQNLKAIRYEGTVAEFKAMEKGYEAYTGDTWRSGSQIMKVICSNDTLTFEYLP